jgi:hypothetical protein
MQSIPHFTVDKGIIAPILLAQGSKQHLSKDPQCNAKKQLSNTATYKIPHLNNFPHIHRTPYMMLACDRTTCYSYNRMLACERTT